MAARRYPPRRPRRLLLPEDYGLGADPLESEIAGRIIQALRAIGCDVRSTQQTRASRQTIGLPDLYVTHAAWRVAAWIEVKRPGERPTAAQRGWHERTQAAGVHVIIATSPGQAVSAFAALPRGREK